MLLVDNDVAKEVVEVNSLNERGMSPLDESEAGDLEFHTILQKEGAKDNILKLIMRPT